MPPSIEFLWLIPTLPLIAAAVGAVVPRRHRLIASGAALAAMAAAFALSCIALPMAIANPGAPATSNFLWIETGALKIYFGVLLDPLAALMLVMVSFVGFLIFLFSTVYMRDDENYAKFFSFLSLFAAAMLGMLVANSLLLVFICWELVGLASYLLIGFWFHKPAAAAAAKKAFITTRIGDIGFLLGLLWLHHATGTQLFYDGGAGCLEQATLAKLALNALPCGLAISSAIGLLFFAGAAGKSGQFPLHVWLPDAMEGPTPVSALIHAATMVAAGVFLMVRVFPLLAFDADGTVLTVIAYTGAFTALLGALIAVAQNDIKRVLAFSTVSQLGYMMLAIGVGCPQAAIFHLLAHAFFKALLFLGAGSIIHAAHHEQDIRRMGGLASRMKITFATFATGMMALSGVPFLFSGFWSKEAILHGAQHWQPSQIPFCIALLAVTLTAFYMTRLMAYVFFGTARSHAAASATENSRAVTIPLIALAVCSVVFGFFITPAWSWLYSKISQTGTAAATTAPLFDPSKLLDGAGLTLASIALVALGIGSAWKIYGRRELKTATDSLEKAFPAFWRTLENRLYFDEIYAATIFKAHNGIAAFADALDRHLIGGCVRLTGKLGNIIGLVNRDIVEPGINTSFATSAESLRTAGTAYSRSQNGDIRSYLRILAFAFAIIAAACILFLVIRMIATLPTA
ncbi:MAG: NADH-quinone oxidoreductase subunit L [Puniceicoccales bacterium]|jgi:NADH-quinone oxidoreductase subunit L|nr:NADH-quinone oxidoreductase subunit L [Puniceicoccales bacterium]